MRGSAELARLASLFRIGAETARQIANFRPTDSGSIERLASEVEDMADRLDAIVSGPGSFDSGEPNRIDSRQ